MSNTNRFLLINNSPPYGGSSTGSHLPGESYEPHPDRAAKPAQGTASLTSFGSPVKSFRPESGRHN
jgi:hypothetical protein